MFEDQMVELLPARTTMSWKKKGRKYGGHGNTTVTLIGNFAVIDGNNNQVAQSFAVSGEGDATALSVNVRDVELS